jgi:hypothetical protein
MKGARVVGLARSVVYDFADAEEQRYDRVRAISSDSIREAGLRVVPFRHAIRSPQVTYRCQNKIVEVPAISLEAIEEGAMMTEGILNRALHVIVQSTVSIVEERSAGRGGLTHKQSGNSVGLVAPPGNLNALWCACHCNFVCSK